MTLRMPYGALRGFVHAALLIGARLGGAGRGAGRPHPRVRRQPYRRLRPAARARASPRSSRRRSGATASARSSPMPASRATPRPQGRARLSWTLDGLRPKPDLAIVALGANDMLRGLPPRQTRADLDAILAELKRRGHPGPDRRHAGRRPISARPMAAI